MMNYNIITSITLIAHQTRLHVFFCLPRDDAHARFDNYQFKFIECLNQRAVLTCSINYCAVHTYLSVGEDERKSNNQASRRSSRGFDAKNANK